MYLESAKRKFKASALFAQASDNQGRRNTLRDGCSGSHSRHVHIKLDDEKQIEADVKDACYRKVF